jgi:hypothetical protein
MKFISTVFNFYVNASIHVAFAVLAFMAITVIEYDLQISASLWFFVFFGTVAGYNFIKNVEIVSRRDAKTDRWLRFILGFSFMCFGLTIYFASQLSIETMGLATILSLLTFFYAVPLLKQSSLRNLGGIKIFIVGLVWSGVTVILPVVASKMVFDADIWLTFAQRFFMVLALTLPFEIRDLHLDISALKTIPQQLGLSKTRSFGYFLLLATLVLDGFKDEFSTVYFISLLIICVIIIGVLITSEEKQRKHFASFWVEGIPIYWLALLLLLKELF